MNNEIPRAHEIVHLMESTSVVGLDYWDMLKILEANSISTQSADHVLKLHGYSPDS